MEWSATLESAFLKLHRIEKLEGFKNKEMYNCTTLYCCEHTLERFFDTVSLKITYHLLPNLNLHSLDTSLLFMHITLEKRVL